MTKEASSNKSHESFVSGASEMYERLRVWRKAHPQATFDDIAREIRREREQLTGRLAAEMAVQEKKKEQWQEEICPECGKVAHYKGMRKRQVVHEEGESTLERPYYRCRHCGNGFFPLG